MIDAWSRRIHNENTRDLYVYAVEFFLAFYKTLPEESLTWMPEEAEDRMMAWQNDLMSKDYAGSTIHTYINGVRRWFLDHRVRILPTTRGIPKTKTYLDYIPSRADAQIVLDALKMHYKVGLAFVAFSGLRPSDSTALKYENVKASIESNDKILTIIKRHKKTKEWYASFLGTQGTRYLMTLLNARRGRGETIRDDSYLVSANGKRLSPRALCFAVDLAIRQTVGKHPTGEPFRRFRPYGFRKYFRRSVNQLGESYAEYMVGHAKALRGLEATYNGLRDLDPVAIEAIKKEYVSILNELETEVTDTTLKAQLQKQEEEREALADRMRKIEKGQEELKEFLEELRKKD